MLLLGAPLVDRRQLDLSFEVTKLASKLAERDERRINTCLVPDDVLGSKNIYIRY